MLSERLKRLREEKGLKQETLAYEIGCTRYMVSYFENGRAPSYEVLKAYCSFFDVSSDYLLGLSNERKPIGDALSNVLDRLAQIAGESAAPKATDLIALMEAAAKYYYVGAPCGDRPLLAFQGFVDGLRAAIDAAIKGDASGLIDSANAAVIAALEVTNMPAQYYAKLSDPTNTLP